MSIRDLTINVFINKKFHGLVWAWVYPRSLVDMLTISMKAIGRGQILMEAGYEDLMVITGGATCDRGSR